MPYQPGEILLGKYRIEAVVGRGAFAEVYRATHLALNAPRALKVLRRDAPGLGSAEFADFQARFQLEAQLGARLDHPHVIRVYDFEQDGETLILVMEYAAGGSLAERMAQARQAGEFIPIAEAVRIAREAAAGLAALHSLDAVHRDVKPPNLLFDAQGRVKVSDLGLAQIPHSPSQRSLVGSLAPPQPGTPAYKSPEQEATISYLTSASDVYSLGVVLFEMLTGRAYKNLKPGTRARSLQGDVPEWLDELVVRMLVQVPEGRPWDGAEVAGTLAEGERSEAGKRIAAEAAQRAEEENPRIEADRRMSAAAAQPVLKERPRIEADMGMKEQVLELTPGVKLTLVRVPAGEFLMGSDKAVDPDAGAAELPQHHLTLPEYWIGKYPVTVAQFAAFVKATGYKTTGKRSIWEKIIGVYWQRPDVVSNVAQKVNHPVTRVSWYDAVAFCEWASKVTGRTIRLPSEAEWEKAASWAEGQGPGGAGGRKLLYPWGDAAPTKKLCNFNWNVEDTTQVGRYSPAGDSPYGCADMVGNLDEWT